VKTRRDRPFDLRYLRRGPRHVLRCLRTWQRARRQWSRDAELNIMVAAAEAP
jgi:hypothetical protein